MRTQDLIARALQSPAFIDLQNSGAIDLLHFQSIVELAVKAERDGLLEQVLVPISQSQGSYDLLVITGATARGQEFLSES